MLTPFSIHSPQPAIAPRPYGRGTPVAESIIVEDVFHAIATASPVAYHFLLPRGFDSSERLPLILHLHGAMSSSAFLKTAKPTYDAAWDSGHLPRAIVACASTPTLGGFYIDHPDGQAWERLVGSEFPEHLAAQFRLSAARAVVGFSMGGYGALKLAFRQPQRYRAVAALCPAIFPAEVAGDVPEKNLPAVLGDLNRAMGKTSVHYADNCVQSLLRAHRADIVSSGLKIFLECGERDEFGLHDGAAHLHQLLTQLAVDHLWESAPAIGHGDHGAERLAKALGFLGQALLG